MASQIDICNLALAKLGTQAIPSLTSNDPKAAILNRMYPLLLAKLQRVYRWSFCLTYAELPALVDVPLFEYNYAYALPTDCLQLYLCDVSLGNSIDIGMPGASMGDWNFNRLQNYRVVGRNVYTSIPAPLRIQYGRLVTDTAQFDAAFNESFACYMAWQLCEQLTGSGSKKDAAAKEYQFSMREARLANAVELPPETIPDDTFMGSRLSS